MSDTGQKRANEGCGFPTDPLWLRFNQEKGARDASSFQWRGAEPPRPLRMARPFYRDVLAPAPTVDFTGGPPGSCAIDLVRDDTVPL
jgi:hypothetical protein